MKIYIEELALWNIFQVLFCIFKQIKGEQSEKKIRISYIDGTFGGVLLLRGIGLLLGWKIYQLTFDLFKVREENNDLIRLNIFNHHLWEIKEKLQQEYPEIFCESHNKDLGMFLIKSVLYVPIFQPGSLSRAIYIKHVITNDMKLRGIDNCLLIMLNLAWKKPVQDFAQKPGIQVHYLKHFQPIVLPMSQSTYTISEVIKRHAREVGLMHCREKLLWFKRIWERYKVRPITGNPNVMKDKSGKIASFGKGSLHYKNDGMFSDIFFSFRGPLKKEKLVLLRVQGKKSIIKQLNDYNINYCCMGPPEEHIDGVNYYPGPQKVSKPNYKHYKTKSPLSALEQRWLKYHQAYYQYKKDYWKGFVHHQNIKVFHTWFKYDSEHMAIADAMRETGGVMSLWQISFEELANVEFLAAADIFFAFSNSWMGANEEIIGSKITFRVNTGFIGSNYELLRPKALELRKKLHLKGAKKIVACFDENASGDPRWNVGEEIEKIHYKLLLEKVLEHSWLGVIFKPKQPQTLRKRLGEVLILLEEAEKTGRCLVLEASGLYASIIPPVMAGLAADVAIQGSMNAGTTAFECALAGIPTLSIDLEGVSKSRLYELGEGQVVFRNYEDMWEILQEHWNSTEGIPRFGDWSPLLDEMDQFRDNRGSERVGTYLHWLIQGFEQGKHREQILEEAAERYCSIWGQDKIITTP